MDLRSSDGTHSLSLAGVHAGGYFVHRTAVHAAKTKNATTIGFLHGGPGALEFVVEYTFGAVCFASNGRLTMLRERDSMVHGARVKPRKRLRCA